MKAEMNLVSEGGTVKAMTVNPDKKTKQSELILTILKSWKSGIWSYNLAANTLVFVPTAEKEEKE